MDDAQSNRTPTFGLTALVLSVLCSRLLVLGLMLILVTYGTFALLVVFFSGSIVSNDRYAYTIVSLAIAAGLFLSRHAQLSIPLLLWAVMTLICFTIRFAHNTWVA